MNNKTIYIHDCDYIHDRDSMPRHRRPFAIEPQGHGTVKHIAAMLEARRSAWVPA